MERAQQDANLAFLNEVKLYIMENMDKEDLTVDDIASRMCMSRTTFYNKWKLLTGEAPKYLISRIGDGEGTGTFGKRKIFCDYGC
ncbi:AraC family transcriptional regulator [Bacteroides uniformis]|nr:AraC family transcriptional regulator [Bacteroides uniformis]